MKAIDMVGRKFGRLVVLQPAQRRYGKRAFWCKCDCGTERVVVGTNLRDGTTVSCGCFREEHRGDVHRKHGLTKTPTYSSWQAMRVRCSRVENWQYKYYGGRGIRVCERWLKFENFLADMGIRPAGLTLDRIDPNGHYEPGNCRWSSRAEQRRNRRDSRMVA